MPDENHGHVLESLIFLERGMAAIGVILGLAEGWSGVYVDAEARCRFLPPSLLSKSQNKGPGVPSLHISFHRATLRMSI